MNIPITIDTATISSQLQVSKEELFNLMDNIVKGLAVAYAESLKEVAMTTLKGSKGARYANLINVIDRERMVGTVLIDYSKDSLMGKIDQGSAPFDMKPGFLKSSKAKVDRHGNRYMSIPFRWSTPGAVSDSGTFANQMPIDIYNIVKSKAANSPIKLSEIPAPLTTPTTRPRIVDNKGSVLFEEYQRKSPIYQGIQKITDDVTGQNRYMSFRRVSEKSDPNSWIHPGFQALNLTDQAFTGFNVEQNLSILMDAEFARLGFNNQ